MKHLFTISLLLTSVFLLGCVSYQDVEPHPLGWQSPALSAPDQNGQAVNLKSATSGPWAIVFFYPKADTPG